MTDFFTEAMPYAVDAHRRTGVLLSVILAQWADETAYGGPDWSQYHNPGNVGSFDNQPIKGYATLADGVTAYVDNMNSAMYAPVRAAQGYVAQCVTLGDSPWASGHYNNGGGPGSALVAIIRANQLDTLDNESNRKETMFDLFIINVTDGSGGEYLWDRRTDKVLHIDTGETVADLEAAGVKALRMSSALLALVQGGGA